MSTSTTQQPQGPDWLTLRPEHFNRDLLPHKHRNAPEGLFPVTEALPPASPKGSTTAAELDGQGDLFSDWTE